MPMIEEALVSPEVMADLEEVCHQASSGRALDPELLRRVYERSAKARADVLHRYGVQDIGVPIIREMRERE